MLLYLLRLLDDIAALSPELQVVNVVTSSSIARPCCKGEHELAVFNMHRVGFWFGDCGNMASPSTKLRQCPSGLTVISANFPTLAQAPHCRHSTGELGCGCTEVGQAAKVRLHRRVTKGRGSHYVRASAKPAAAFGFDSTCSHLRFEPLTARNLEAVLVALDYVIACTAAP
eukprot:6481337-Amphidinium_carterae.1